MQAGAGAEGDTPQHGADVLRSLSFPPELVELAEQDEPTSLPPRRLGLAGWGSGPQGVGFTVQSLTFTEPSSPTDSRPPSAATPRPLGPDLRWGPRSHIFSYLRLCPPRNSDISGDICQLRPHGVLRTLPIF